MSSRNRGFIFIEALIAVSIVTVTALLCASTIRMSASSRETIRRKMEESDRQMRDQFSREEECRPVCSEETDADSS